MNCHKRTNKIVWKQLFKIFSSSRLERDVVITILRNYTSDTSIFFLSFKYNVERYSGKTPAFVILRSKTLSPPNAARVSRIIFRIKFFFSHTKTGPAVGLYENPKRPNKHKKTPYSDDLWRPFSRFSHPRWWRSLVCPPTTSTKQYRKLITQKKKIQRQHNIAGKQVGGSRPLRPPRVPRRRPTSR